MTPERIKELRLKARSAPVESGGLAGWLDECLNEIVRLQAIIKKVAKPILSKKELRKVLDAD